MTSLNLPSLSSCGDAGDAITALPILKSIGAGMFYAMDRPPCQPFIPRIPLIKRLFEAQTYVLGVRPYTDQKVTYDTSTFRKGGFPYGKTLAELQSNWVKVKVDTTNPWLSVEPDPRTAGKIVVARSPRYNNPHFPWKSLVEVFGEDMVFVGIKDEHRAFVEKYGAIPWHKTKDLYEVAQAIAGSELFIGNQSSPNAIAEGLKHNSIQEVCVHHPDCIYPRTNAKFCFDGELSFEALGKEFRSEPVIVKAKVNTHLTPPGGWQFSWDGVKVKSYCFESALTMLKQKLREAKKDIPKDLKELMVEQVRENSGPTPEWRPFYKVRELIREKYRTAGMAIP